MSTVSGALASVRKTTGTGGGHNAPPELSNLEWVTHEYAAP